MAAKMLLIRPNFLVLRMASLSFLRETTCFSTRNYHLLKGRSVHSRKVSLSCIGRATKIELYRRNLSVQATENPDSIKLPLTESMEKKIKEQLSAETVVVNDASGDGRHVCIEVISSAFEGKSAVNRQRMVYKAIWEELEDMVHAVDQMTTQTPSEAASRK